MKYLPYYIIAFLIGLLLFLYCKKDSVGDTTTSGAVVDSIVTRVVVSDTIPKLRDSVVIRYKYEIIPIADTIKSDTVKHEISAVVSGDSIELQIPISQNTYVTDDYRAYVSGYSAKLDSIFINRKETTLHIRDPAKQKKFTIGLQAGYGMTPKGFQPYIGLGVTYNLMSW